MMWISPNGNPLLESLSLSANPRLVFLCFLHGPGVYTEWQCDDNGGFKVGKMHEHHDEPWD